MIGASELFARPAAAFAVLAAALALTAIAWLASLQGIEAQSRARFDEEVGRIHTEIRQRIDAYVAALHAIKALFKASVSVERDEFRQFVRSVNLVERHPGILGIGFIRRVPAAGLNGFVARMRAEPAAVAPAFKVSPRGFRPEHYVVDYVEPFERNRAFFGQDVLVEATRRAALTAARDSGEPTSTERIELVGEGPRGEPGINIFVPIYRNGASIATPAERRAALMGFVFARFSVKQLFAQIFSSLPRRAVHVEIFDGREHTSDHLLYDDDDETFATGAGRRDRFETTRELDVAGRKWKLIFSADPSGVLSQRNYTPTSVLVAGGIISLLLFGITWTQIRNIQSRRRQAEILGYQATHDTLTDLPNRNFLYRQFLREVAQHRRGRMTLMLIDLNGFKEINDTLGHHSGDDVLRLIGPRLLRTVGRDGTVARLGGDEFAVLFRSIADSDEALRRAQTILETIHEPFEISGITVQIGASIGIAIYPEHGSDISTLMRCADVAMYQAKDSVAGYDLYRPELDQHSPRRLALMTELSGAIAKGGLTLHYQPIVDLRNHSISGIEALVRWQHPVHGLIAPEQFIPQAEKSELIKPLTHWVLDQALAQSRRWRDAGIRLRVSVNISTRNLQESDFPERVAALLTCHDLPPHSLELEITESALIFSREQLVNALARVSEMGVMITMDDFGTGYSSLALLKNLPVSRLKVDQSFVRDMLDDEDDRIIVNSVIHLAHNLGMAVVAEGVENREVLAQLEKLGCDAVQGDYISRALDAPAASEWLAQRLQEKSIQGT